MNSNIRVLFIRLYAFFCFKKRSKVIFYHDIHSRNKYTEMSTAIDLFIEHIKHIKNCGYEIVSKVSKSYGQIEICFDDGFLGLYENFDVIKKYNIPIRIFMITSYIGKEKYLSQKQILELYNTGLVNISSHTHTHSKLTSLSDDEIEFELFESKKILENIINQPIDAICFPLGLFNKQVIKLSSRFGYSMKYISLPGFINSSQDIIKRSLVQFASINTFGAILKGGDHCLYFWYKLKHYSK
tara:strand:- start:414 stop:1136 length:723 start_codon:yes stop_codon:yes gene_type:complete